VLISVITTVRNEERNISDFLDSMVVQEQPIEVIIVDAHSHDRTVQIAQNYASRFPFVRVVVQGGTRATGRDYGVKIAKGDIVAFIDGDAIVNPFWASRIRKAMSIANVVAGKTIQIGYEPFEDLERVELIYRGYDITYPSTNLTYRKEAFLSAGGFDEWFITAEDIDLNLRAVRAGNTIHYEKDAIVYHRTRGTIYDFFRQAFWNGAGRKQLTMKHGALWRSYRPFEMFKRQVTLWSLLRLSVALTGYLAYKMFGKRLSATHSPIKSL
jgi:glycosyltransferase involved in cell wall biosynthesis